MSPPALFYALVGPSQRTSVGRHSKSCKPIESTLPAWEFSRSRTPAGYWCSFLSTFPWSAVPPGQFPGWKSRETGMGGNFLVGNYHPLPSFSLSQKGCFTGFLRSRVSLWSDESGVRVTGHSPRTCRSHPLQRLVHRS